MPREGLAQLPPVGRSQNLQTEKPNRHTTASVLAVLAATTCLSVCAEEPDARESIGHLPPITPPGNLMGDQGVVHYVDSADQGAPVRTGFSRHPAAPSERTSIERPTPLVVSKPASEESSGLEPHGEAGNTGTGPMTAAASIVSPARATAPSSAIAANSSAMSPRTPRLFVALRTPKTAEESSEASSL